MPGLSPSGEPTPFIEGQVCTIELAVEITCVFPPSLEHARGVLRCRVLGPWGAYKYWDCTPDKLRAVTKP